MRRKRDSMNKKIISCVYQPLKKMKFKTNRDVEKARRQLEAFHKRPLGICSAKNTVNIEYDLQIIIPAYNVEQYIEACINSVIQQKSKYNILLTIINDGSTDNTASILRHFMAIDNIEIITQDNKGFSGARNRGLKYIKGKYILFLDSDDELEPNSIDDFLSCAIENDVDILQGNWTEFASEYEKENKIDTGLTQLAVLSGYPWGKLYKWNVLESFQFPEGFWFEDTPISFILERMPYKKMNYSGRIYRYRINPNGITQTAILKNKSVDTYWITEQCLQELHEFGLKYDENVYIYFLNQIYTNYMRTRKMPTKIRRAIYILSVDCFNKYFKINYSIENERLNLIKESLCSNSYLKYELIMALLR